MSGLEAAGLVLGIIPLAVKAVQCYRETFYSIKRVKRDLDYLERDLQTEQLRLQNTCETLLIGIVPPTKIHSMIEDPFGLEWKSYSDQLRLRLYTSCDKFEKCIMEMSVAAHELRQRLGIEEGSQINPQDQASILEAFKRNASFTLQKKEYEDVLSRIKASNAVLQDLSRVHRELEPDRRSRSQLRITKLVRRLSQSVYYALCRALTCACVYSHDIGIQLSRRYPIMLPNDVEDKVAQELDFRITLRTSTADENGTIQTLQYTNTTRPMSHWNDFQLRLMNGDQPILNSLTSSPPSHLPTKKPRRIRWALPIKLGVSKRIRSTPSIPNPPIQTPVSHEKTPGGLEIPTTRVSDLCDILQRSTTAPAVNCYGYVDDVPHKFMVSPPNDGTGPHKHITLRQVIDRSVLNLPLFGFEERLQVALALSVSFLHLDGTPWLAQIMTLDDIGFMVGRENASNRGSSLLYRPFVIKRIRKTPALPPPTPSKTTTPVRTLGIMRPINPELLSLGVLLTQIIIGRVDNELEMTRLMDIKAIISVRRRGSQLEEETLVNGGMNYAAAVKWCLDNIHSVAGLQNDKFCHDFYGAVIARLQDDINTITSDP
ncbi:hypothetical protein F5X98DRAFT_357338 [Xylaria grammica]|nr:hypothetical protein F5X98DRAFT_357338 [Xylaria grammica]